MGKSKEGRQNRQLDYMRMAKNSSRNKNTSPFIEIGSSVSLFTLGILTFMWMARWRRPAKRGPPPRGAPSRGERRSHPPVESRRSVLGRARRTAFAGDRPRGDPEHQGRLALRAPRGHRLPLQCGQGQPAAVLQKGVPRLGHRPRHGPEGGGAREEVQEEVGPGTVGGSRAPGGVDEGVSPRPATTTRVAVSGVAGAMRLADARGNEVHCGNRPAGLVVAAPTTLPAVRGALRSSPWVGVRGSLCWSR